MTDVNDPAICPECGMTISSDAPGGLCPACLVRAGFCEDGDPAPTPAPARFEPPSIDRLAELCPHLEILELIGIGGMGAVYKAKQTALDRVVALKVLPPEVARDSSFSERFARETRSLARLNHPNIVAIYDSGQAGGMFYFVMEYVDGVNLRQMMHGEGGRPTLTPQQSLEIVPQICQALQYAHDEGIVHRDIKPDNILVDRRGRVKIADFGLAKLLGRDSADDGLTASQQVMGTFRYMAPEQLEGGRHADHRSDIYSLGVVFYELLTGETPMGRFDPPSKLAAVDARLDEVVLRSLQRDPERRYQRASHIDTDLQAVSHAAPPLPANQLSAKHLPTPGQQQKSNLLVVVMIVLLVACCVPAIPLGLLFSLYSFQAAPAPNTITITTEAETAINVANFVSVDDPAKPDHLFPHKHITPGFCNELTSQIRGQLAGENRWRVVDTPSLQPALEQYATDQRAIDRARASGAKVALTGTLYCIDRRGNIVSQDLDATSHLVLRIRLLDVPSGAGIGQHEFKHPIPKGPMDKVDYQQTVSKQVSQAIQRMWP